MFVDGVNTPAINVPIGTTLRVDSDATAFTDGIDISTLNPCDVLRECNYYWRTDDDQTPALQGDTSAHCLEIVSAQAVNNVVTQQLYIPSTSYSSRCTYPNMLTWSSLCRQADNVAHIITCTPLTSAQIDSCRNRVCGLGTCEQAFALIKCSDWRSYGCDCNDCCQAVLAE